VQFDEKGDRKDAEITIFKLVDGKVKPVAIVKNGKSTPFNAEASAAGQAQQGEAKPAETKK
jgi:branched-chain amino acid transport system substrate-binding protein